MTREEITEGLRLLEDNMVYFDELLNDKGEYIDVHELLFEAIEVLEQEPCEDCISRKSLKHKLQEHHDFFVNAYGGFSNLPQNDKSRVDEITNCIAMVVNEPSIQPKPKTGHWIEKDGFDGDTYYDCSECGESWTTIDGTPWNNGMKYCPNCGAKMESEV